MIGVDRVTIWTMQLENTTDLMWLRMSRAIDAVEQERAARFVFERHRRQYTAAHALARLMLTASVGGTVHPLGWTFVTNAQGKPRVANGMGPHFNLSHCDGLVACAVSHQAEVGVDVESMDRLITLEMVEGSFTAGERIWLRSLPEARRAAGLLQLWTLKEAYIKATGLGLSQRLDAFGFTFEPLRIIACDPAIGDVAEWRFEQKMIGASHILAAAYRGSGSSLPIDLKEVRPETLLP
jgi:4'-phosphopantetheinyl transferase